MIRQLKRFCASLLPPLLLIGIVTDSRADGLQLTLATGDDYAPFTDTELPYGGMASRLVIRAFERSGNQVEDLQWLPWKRGYEHAKAVVVDATFPYGWTAARAEDFDYSSPFFPVQDLAWVKAGSKLDLKTKEDIRGTTFCRARGYANFGMLEELMKQKAIRRETPSTMAICFKLLSIGRVDFVSATLGDAEGAIRDAGIASESVRQTDLVTAEIKLYLIVSKKHPDGQNILRQFNRGLADLENSGELAKIKAEFNWAH